MSEVRKKVGKILTIALILVISFTICCMDAKALSTPMANCGIKSYWTYYTMNLNSLGTIKVNLFNGNLVYTVNDMNFQNLQFNRTYNSQSDLPDIYGNNWRMNYSRKVLDNSAYNNAFLIDSTGAEFTYSRGLGGFYRKPAGAPGSLTNNGVIPWVLTYPDSSRDYYSFNGYLKEFHLGTSLTKFSYSGNYLISVDNMNNRYPVRLYVSPTNAAIEKIVDPLPNGRKVTYTYDAQNNLIKAINAQNATLSYTYQNNLLSGVLSNYLIGRASIGYDNLKRVTSIRDWQGRTVTFRYNYLSTTVVYPSLFTKRAVTFHFNEKGELIGVFVNDIPWIRYDWMNDKLKLVTDAKENTYYYNYDSLDRLESIVTPLNTRVAFGYDEQDNLTTVVDPDGVKYSFEYNQDNQLAAIHDGLDNTYRITRNPDTNEMAIVDPEGKTTSYRTNLEGISTEALDMNGTTLRSVFDESGSFKLSEVVDKDGNIWSKNEFVYDNLDRLVSTTDLAGNSISREYDAENNLRVVKDQKGEVVEYTYTPDNKLETISYNGEKQYTFTYDEELGRLSTVVQKDSEKPFIYNYDGNGRLAESIEPNGNAVKYGYDQVNNMEYVDMNIQGKSFALKYGFDQVNQVVAVDGYMGGSFGFQYDNNGKLKDVVYPNGMVKHFTRDGIGRITDFSIEGTPIWANYSYDKNSNLLSATDQNKMTTYYTYNDLNCLETELDPYTGEETVYTYDAAGNRTTKTIYHADGSVKYSTGYGYEGLGIPVKDGRVLHYGLRGNLVNDGLRSYVWDAENRLIEVRDRENQVIASFTYDYQGKRLSKTTPKYTTYYHYVGNKVAYETDEFGNPGNMYTYSVDGAPLTLTKDGITYYYLTDMRGDALGITDAEGKILATYRYDAFGNVLAMEGDLTLLNPYRFAGYAYDVETGLYYVDGKYYDADAGRFLNRVRAGANAISPVEANGYIPTNNNCSFGGWDGDGDPCPTPIHRHFILMNKCPFHHCPWCPDQPHPWDPHDPDNPWYRIPDFSDIIQYERDFDSIIGWDNVIDKGGLTGGLIDITNGLIHIGNISKAMEALKFKNGVNAEFVNGGVNQAWK